MCGRFVRRASPVVIAEAFGLHDAPAMEAHYNIAPSQAVAVVRHAHEKQANSLFCDGD